MHAPNTRRNSRGSWKLAAFSIALAAFWTPVAPHGQPSGPQATATVDPALTRKICQVVGEVDRHFGVRTVNATESRFGFWGTDLGFSFEHKGRLAVLFGDTEAAAGVNRVRDRDVLAFSDTADPEDCLRLSVPLDADGGFRPLVIPGVDGGAFSVPTGGFGVGDDLYVIATTGKTADSPMARSVLARSRNDGRDFERVYELSDSRFINAAPAVTEARQTPGLPTDEAAVLLWGSGTYRRSVPSLAAAPAARIDDRSALRYFAGLDDAGTPVWSARETDSAALFEQACLGELSVAWNPVLERWMMLYNCAARDEAGAERNRILIRTAPRPWGPWSEAQVVFDMDRDGGACRFLNPPPSLLVRADTGACPDVSDPHIQGTTGDPYAPALIARFTRGVRGSHSEIQFLMSTWNPYSVVQMRATLRLGGPAP